MSSNFFSITDYGAKEGGVELCSAAFAEAIAACEQAGGGTVYVPAGKYLTGPLLLKSDMRLFVDAGAHIMFVQDQEQYPVVNSRWEGVDGSVYQSCIFAIDSHDIIIEGSGTLDGQGEYWWKGMRERTLKYARPKLVSFHNCQRITLKGVKLINSPAWTFNPIYCTNVLVDGITIDNPADSPNTDGVNPESCDMVRVQGCYISVGDDCVTLKSGTEHASRRVPCQNITVTNCVMAHGHGGVVIGSEMSGGVRNVSISNCVFFKTDRGIRIKTRRGRGGTVEDVRVNNIVMDQVNCPFVINLYYHCGPDGHEKHVWDKAPYPVDEKTPVVRRVYFSNITAKDVRSCAGFIYGLPESMVEDISFDNMLVMLGEGHEPEMPAMLDYVDPMTKKGFFVANAKDIDFTRVTVTGADGEAFRIESSEGVRLDGCKAKDCTGELLQEV
jgi:polygalacturonase